MSPQDTAHALDPRRSVVVEACAGSGKTWLLVSRIIRLLLAGAKPGEILAITFTRKAAEEMRQRLIDWLEFLAVKSDDEVCDFLRERQVEMSDIDSALPIARGLLEAFLTALQPITLTTFHGWFAQLLQAAPLRARAGVDATLSEDTRLLLLEAWQSLNNTARASPEGDVARSLATLYGELGLTNTRKLLSRFVEKRTDWWAYTIGKKDPLSFVLQELAALLEIDPADDPLSALDDEHLVLRLTALARALDSGSAAARAKGAAITAALAMAEREERLAALESVLFTKDKTLAQHVFNATKKMGGNACDDYSHVMEQLTELQETRTGHAIYHVNRLGLTAGVVLLKEYQDLKESRQLSDFADLEWQAFHLLNHSDAAETMQYKLDCRYRHVLVDEFQDTNPLQWLTLKAWLEASISAENPPSVFLVGDPKQSIYRFRRADARLFDVAATYLEKELAALRTRANRSRRCAPAILDVVNRLFAGREHFVAHESAEPSLPGEVRVLPLAAGGDGFSLSDAPRALRNPLTTPLPAEPAAARDHEARQLAAAILDLVGKVQVRGRDARPRPAEYRDILLLKRARTGLEKYEAALREARIPYVSARRGSLLDTLEAADIMALLEFLIAPDDDLKLAHALRSPIFACADEDLCMLALGDGGAWWARLAAVVAGDRASPALCRAHRLLDEWQAAVDRLPVHDLLDRLYFQSDVEARYQAAAPAHLANSVVANLRAFMALALATDSGRYPSLPRFLYELADYQRDADDEAPDEGSPSSAENAVRIMTIHGAKGLEAPIVILADSNAGGRNNDAYGVLGHWPLGATRPDHFSLCSTANVRGRARAPFFDEEERVGEQENWNLLYVAMTRTRQMLMVSGCEAARPGSWYIGVAECVRDVAAGLPQVATPVASPSGQIAREEDIHDTVPAIGVRRARIETAAMAFGIQFHALLDRATTGGELANDVQWAAIPGSASAQAVRVLDAVRAVTANPALRRFYDPSQYVNALNEVEYIGNAGEVRRIDRLVEFHDAVWVLDYKSGIEVQQAHRSQLEDYAEAARKLYPAKRVHCGVILGNGTLIELS